MWWQEGGDTTALGGSEHEQAIHPSDESGRMGRQTLTFGQEQGSFRLEVCALYQATRVFDGRDEGVGAAPSYIPAVIARTRPDETAIIEV